MIAVQIIISQTYTVRQKSSLLFQVLMSGLLKGDSSPYLELPWNTSFLTYVFCLLDSIYKSKEICKCQKQPYYGVSILKYI